MTSPARVRPAAVAGSFYPRDAKTLRRNIDALFQDAPRPVDSRRPLLLIEPHAGYMYSGRVAAYGYRLLQDIPLRSVVLIGPSHMEYFPFASVFDGDAYETPLGIIPVDRELAAELASKHPLLQLSDCGHLQTQMKRREHALEVQLPFLQRLASGLHIVPIVMGDQTWPLCDALGSALANVIRRPETLVVISSDLSHFHPYDAAKKLDAIFCGALEKMNPRRLFDLVEGRACEACGAGPVVAGVIACRQVGATDCQVLTAANSGDVTGDHSSVVGYAAAAIFDRSSRESMEDEDAAAVELLVEERDHILRLVRHEITTALGGRSESPVRPERCPVLDQHRGVFVTLKAKGRLRGCIGTVAPQKPLLASLTDMAGAAAFSDPRFGPVRSEELSDLSIEVSLLSPPRSIPSPEHIEIGRHGLIIESGSRRGLLLPQVAVEHGWDVTTFVERACEKAGLAIDAWRQPDVRMLVFEAEVFGEDPTRAV